MTECDKINNAWDFLRAEHYCIQGNIKNLEFEDEQIITQLKILMQDAKEKGFKLNNHTMRWE